MGTDGNEHTGGTDAYDNEHASGTDAPPDDGSQRADTDANTSFGEGGGDQGRSRECHRRGCTKRASFVVRERYLEETGKGAVVATAALCRAHTAEERPTNLEDAYPDYLFRVDPISGADGSDDTP